jgi:hypothetical protein
VIAIKKQEEPGVAKIQSMSITKIRKPGRCVKSAERNTGSVKNVGKVYIQQM